MKENTKKILAREGIILLGIVLLTAIIIFGLRTTEYVIVGEQLGQQIVTFAFILMFLGYPIYLLIRFIIWAIKTLKGSK